MLKYLSFTILFSLVIVQFLIPEERRQSPVHDLPNYLPEEVGKWKRDGPSQVYKGEDLYIYINGGAEIYHEYGFEQVIVQDYKSERGVSISLEIFEMSDSRSAFGIYTFKSSSEGQELCLGDGAQLEDYYMNFWKGNLLITLVGYDEEAETRRGLQEIARRVDEGIKFRGEKPRLISFLPDKGFKKGSMKYFKGNLGLYNCYPFFLQDVFSLKDGVKGDYEAGYSVFILETKEDKNEEQIFEKIKNSFKESSRYGYFNPVDHRTFRVKDNKGRSFFISHWQNFILIIAGPVKPKQAENIFFSLRQRIKQKKLP